jgi:hypothetical protein
MVEKKRKIACSTRFFSSLLEDADPHVKRVLARLVEANTAGDPMSYLL